jgi:hypothetical protein
LQFIIIPWIRAIERFIFCFRRHVFALTWHSLCHSHSRHTKSKQKLCIIISFFFLLYNELSVYLYFIVLLKKMCFFFFSFFDYFIFECIFFFGLMS